MYLFKLDYIYSEMIYHQKKQIKEKNQPSSNISIAFYWPQIMIFDLPRDTFEDLSTVILELSALSLTTGVSTSPLE